MILLQAYNVMDVQLLRRSTCETGKKHLTNLPKSFEHARNQLINMQNDLQHKGNKYCSVNNVENIFKFTCKNSFELFKLSEHVFGDRTFFHSLLLILFIFIRFTFFKITITVAYCFLWNIIQILT